MFWGASFKKRYSELHDEPQIELEVHNCFHPAFSTCSFLIDSGSSTTAINEEVFDILNLQYSRQVPVEYADSGQGMRDTCFINLRFPQLGYEEKQLEVIIHPDKSQNLLGRDILNKMSLFLYGKKRVLKIKV